MALNSPLFPTLQPSAQALGKAAAASLEAEARLTPKPGLVDSANTGAHKDMSLDTFLVSAAALEPYFEEYAAAGFSLGPSKPAELANEARYIGIRAEEAMFASTGGINTHKGANFTFALVLSATGALLSDGATLPFSAEGSARMLDLVSAMGAELLDRDTRSLLARTKRQSGQDQAGLSNGERIYLAQGLKGVRGEAAQGYPLLGQVFMPYVRSQKSELSDPANVRIVLLRALVKLMASLEDTNVVHRGGMNALTRHLAYCQEIDREELPAKQLIEALKTYDQDLIATNVSPGGAADLLSLGVFFAQLEGLIGPVESFAQQLA